MRTRGLALTNIYQNYKTIVVTDNDSKTSRIVTFKAIGVSSTKLSAAMLTSKASMISNTFKDNITGESKNPKGKNSTDQSTPKIKAGVNALPPFLRQEEESS